VDLLLGDRRRHVVNKQVGLELLVDILVDGSFGLVLSQVVLAPSNMVTHKEVAAICTFLLVEFFYSDGSRLRLFVADKGLV
jgi:hypothetical protein